MKNLHLIATEKPSIIGLHFDIIKEGRFDYAPNFGFTEFNRLRNFQHNPVHIYITSHEEIKAGVEQWYFDYFLNKPRNSSGAEYGEKQYVIILTTDQELIADGVQAIDNEFLEWFVKNSSCDVVEVETYFKKIGVETDANGYREMDILAKHYRLSIPKEESIVKDLNYWKANAEEDYMRVPISVLRYISELENKMYSEDYMKKIAFAFYYDMSHKMGVPEDLINENFDNVGVWFKQFKNK